MARRGDALELAILGLLADAPVHGYQLRKQVDHELGWTRLLSYGTLYPRLRQLTRDGYIAADDTSNEPGTGSRRRRIVYNLTAEGKERLADLLEDGGPTAWGDDDFGVRFALFSRTSSPTRMRVLEGRRSRLEERLANVREASAARRKRSDEYTRELRRYGLESVEREIRWLNELIERERAQAFDNDKEQES